MDILKQCEIWNEEEKFEKIVEALEAIPEEERTPQMQIDLGRAYNNRYYETDDAEYLYKALEVLLPYEKQFSEEHKWNFRVGYSYFYLDMQYSALPYLEKALATRPGDEDTLMLLETCKKLINCPNFDTTYRERVERAWEQFVAREHELRTLIDQRGDANPDVLVETVHDIFLGVLKNLSFELGYNSDKYELTLTPEGNTLRLFMIRYISKCAPESIKDRWKITEGRAASKGYGLRAFDYEVTTQDVIVWHRINTETKKVTLQLYCEKLLPLLKTEEGEKNLWWMMETMVDQALGEITAMSIIEDLDLLDEPNPESGVKLDDLKSILQFEGVKTEESAQNFLDNSYVMYSLASQNEEPDENREDALRFDMFAAVTRCPQLVTGYVEADNSAMKTLYHNGISAGSICYPLSGFENIPDEDYSTAILNFRDDLEAALRKATNDKCFTFTGGGTGYYGYLDFIAWDLQATLQAAAEFFAESGFEWAGFQTFDRFAHPVMIWRSDRSEAEEKEESEEA